MEIIQFSEQYRRDVIKLWETCNLTRPWNDPNKDIDRKINFQPELFFIGKLNSKVIASAMAGYDGHRGSVFYLAISPEHQGCGYGKKFMLHIEAALTQLGCPKLNLVVRTGNEKVLGFYNKQEYSKDDVVSLGKRLIADQQ